MWVCFVLSLGLAEIQCLLLNGGCISVGNWVFGSVVFIELCDVCGIKLCSVETA